MSDLTTAPGFFTLKLGEIMFMHYCVNCGEELGMSEHKQRQRDYDTCGKQECDREARESIAAEREEAHEQLDRDMGYGRW